MSVFKNKVIWLCGASSGIGRSLALELIDQGAMLVVSGRRLESMAGLGAELVLSCDVTEEADWQDCAARVKERFGRVDYFIYNAGRCEYLDGSNFSSRVFSAVFEVNVMGLAKAVEAVVPLLRVSERPLLAAVGSSVAWFALPRAEAYGASKAAVSYFLKSLRADLAAERVDVSLILPGFVRTPMTERNDFAMPFIIEADEAARRIVRGLARRRLEIHFPRRFTWGLKILGHCPAFLQHFISRKFVKS